MTQPAGSVLELTGHIDILQARALHARALAAFDTPGDVTLDWSSAISIDAAGMQLLLALQVALSSGGRRLLSGPPPERVMRSLATAGVLGTLVGGLTTP